jgi:hypothetical protein
MKQTHGLSLNAYANVRKMFLKKYIPPGVGFWKGMGGFPVGMFWESGLERNAREGVTSTQVALGGRWVTATACLNILTHR